MTSAGRPDLRVFIGDGVTRPMALNRERKLHWSAVREETGWWKQTAAQLLIHAGALRLGLVRVVFEFEPVYKSGNLPDTGGIFPTEKAIVDGAVEVGVIPDDNRWHNGGQLSRPPISAAQTGVWVTLHPVTPVEHECVCRARWESSQMRNQLKAAQGGRGRR